ncbi:MAG: hypothetical protein H6905_00880 [Hyphomicrobiales bacterium]|nr:hypothetical protein [Hyphomicrobiales bacterium]
MGAWILAQFLIGAATVLFFAWDKFNTPVSYKASTTRERYRLAAVSYYLSMLVVFVLLTLIIWAVPAVVPEDILRSTRQLPIAEGVPEEIGAVALDFHFNTVQQAWEKVFEWLEKSAATVNAPILAALLMTVFLEHVPWLQKIDKGLLESFRGLGRIPEEVQDWRNQLVATSPRISDMAQARIVREISDDPILRDWKAQLLRFEGPQDFAQGAFLRVAHLRHELHELEHDGRFAQLIKNFPELKSARDAIETHYMEMRIEALELAKVTQEAEAGHGRKGPAYRGCLRFFTRSFNGVYAKLCELVAYHLCYCEPTKEDRERKLAELGFCEVKPPRRRLDEHQWAAVGILFFVCIVPIIWFATVLYTGSLNNIQALALGTMVTTIYLFGLWMALLPKGRRWKVAERPSHGRRPYLGYVLSGALAVLASVGISMMTAALVHATKESSFSLFAELRVTYPWYIMAFAFASFIALLLDDEAPADTHPWRFSILGWVFYIFEGRLRTVESASAAVIMFVVSLIASGLFVVMEQTPGLCHGGIVSNCQVPAWYFPAVAATIIGALAGWIVPYWHRGLRREAKLLKVDQAPPPRLVEVPAEPARREASKMNQVG